MTDVIASFTVNDSRYLTMKSFLLATYGAVVKSNALNITRNTVTLSKASPSTEQFGELLSDSDRAFGVTQRQFP